MVFEAKGQPNVLKAYVIKETINPFRCSFGNLVFPWGHFLVVKHDVKSDRLRKFHFAVWTAAANHSAALFVKLQENNHTESKPGILIIFPFLSPSFAGGIRGTA